MLTRARKAQRTATQPPATFVTLLPEAHIAIAKQIDETEAALNFTTASKALYATTRNAVMSRPSLTLNYAALTFSKELHRRHSAALTLRLRNVQFFATFSSANSFGRPMGFRLRTAELRHADDNRPQTIIELETGTRTNYFTLKIYAPNGRSSSYDVVPGSQEHGWVEDLQQDLCFTYNTPGLLDTLIARELLSL
jgi:hypothetical protein